MGIGATSEFPCPLNQTGEPPASDTSDKAKAYRQLTDLYIIGVRATAQAARGLPIGEAYVKALDEATLRTADVVFLDGVLDGARARAANAAAGVCSRAARGRRRWGRESRPGEVLVGLITRHPPVLQTLEEVVCLEMRVHNVKSRFDDISEI